MNTRRSLFLFSCLAANLAALRAAAVDSTLSAVTVYADRAVVTRTAKVQFGASGPSEAVFERLPPGLIDESLRVDGSGTAKITIQDVTARSEYVDYTPNDRVEALETNVNDLQRQRRALDDRVSALNEQQKNLDQIAAAMTRPAKAAQRMSLEEAEKLLVFLDQWRGKIASEQRELDERKEDLEAKRSAAERQLAQLRGAGGRSYKNVTVRFSAGGPGIAELTLSYAIQGAGWNPRYDARLASAAHSVELGYFGVVRQNTGEDWKNVDLTLSTARPSMGGAPPSLGDWTVDIARPAEAPRGASGIVGGISSNSLFFGNAAATGGKSLTYGYAAEGVTLEDKVAPASFAQTGFQPQATSASFRIAVPATVLSDNSPQKVPIGIFSLESESEYVSVPKLIPAAFLDAKVSNSSDYPLLAGSMNVFLDDTFVASSWLRTVMPGEKFDLALGADEGIAVKRVLNRHFTEDTGLMTKGKRITYDYTLTVRNNKRTAEKVVLSDQIPVSRDEKVVVNLRSPDSGDAKPGSDGKLKWTLNLGPGEKREVPLVFAIEFPNGVAVTGIE
jgi:uncharacterized protein (TIGR02231 family)